MARCEYAPRVRSGVSEERRHLDHCSFWRPFTLIASQTVLERTSRIPIPGKPRTTCGDITVTRPGTFRRNPKRVEPAVPEVKAKPDRLVDERRQILDALPANGLQSLVGRCWQAILRSEARHDFACRVKNLHAQFAPRTIDVHEQVLAAKTDRPRGPTSTHETRDESLP